MGFLLRYKKYRVRAYLMFMAACLMVTVGYSMLAGAYAAELVNPDVMVQVDSNGNILAIQYPLIFSILFSVGHLAIGISAIVVIEVLLSLLITWCQSMIPSGIVNTSKYQRILSIARMLKIAIPISIVLVFLFIVLAVVLVQPLVAIGALVSAIIYLVLRVINLAIIIWAWVGLPRSTPNQVKKRSQIARLFFLTLFEGWFVAGRENGSITGIAVGIIFLLIALWNGALLDYDLIPDATVDQVHIVLPPGQLKQPQMVYTASPQPNFTGGAQPNPYYPPMPPPVPQNIPGLPPAGNRVGPS